jgi:hypothetical protein
MFRSSSQVRKPEARGAGFGVGSFAPKFRGEIFDWLEFANQSGK